MVLLIVIVTLFLGRTGSAAVLPLSAEQMVGLSHQIVVAVVEGEQAHWNEQHNLIMTDYLLRIESRLRGEIPDHVTLTMPGGTLGGETHDTSVSVHLRKGDRYLLFFHDLGRPQMTPVTGAFQGVFRESRAADGKSLVIPGDGEAAPLVISGKKVLFQDFVDAVREMVRKAAANGASQGLSGWSATPGKLPAKTYSPLAPGADTKSLRSLSPAAKLSSPDGPGLPDSVLLSSPEILGTEAVGGEKIIGKYVYQRRPAAPWIFNQLPGSFAPWSPIDQNMMAYWNIYAGNLFRILVNPTGTWAWGNGVNDITGFPSDADMVSQFGPAAAWGADTLAVTYTRWSGNGPILEADIAVNPHFQWTSDDAFATLLTNSAYGFRQTILHELGHTWGLQHPWESQRVWWDSVMNYAPKNFRYSKLFSDDAAAVRSAYPGVAIHDGLLSAYVTDYGFGNSPDYFDSLPSPSVVAAGSSFQMTQPITLENVGTDDLVNPAIEVYLTPQRISFDHSIYLGTLRYSDVVHPFPNSSIHRLNTGPLTVPANTPSGLYAVAFFLRDNGDGLQGNNSAWTDTFLQVQGNANLSCSPGATTLCIDDQAGDHRFKVEVAYNTRNGGGLSGNGTAIPLSSLGVNRGGLFWFFSADNPEMLIKVINGCTLNGNYWVFSAAGTNVGLTITVTDTFNGSHKTYTNTDGIAAVPIQDVGAFSCSTR